ncbi:MULTISPECIES: HAD family hydrolase [Paenibacillus]|uniref:Hydrolase of the HAD superfamily n=1 Tax=Paenibacillus pabuli TaxID=1472 RepID=A0ABX9BLS4_9BACL|nr:MULTISPECIES: HAD family hydrolase [Paenibacillus]OAX47998.1 Phosphoglycolate phosphatase [Paenibacillus sp. AD87]RAI98004.1 putative hydrolase of the HAD superfamily [Paenibacillus pabuli]SEL25702.1 putative hydrolase of the HAD superfamily [Paenibacillus sp. OK003]
MKIIKQHILFDLDDTLVYCNKYFNLVLGEFFENMQEWFDGHALTVQQIREKQLEIDVTGVNKLGFASHHFPQSLIDTYRYFSQKFSKPTSHQEESYLTKLGMSVYDQEVEPYPHMVETLENLKSAGHALYLYTGGETVIQQRKIDQMKLSAYFDDRIYIRQHKNIEALEGILSTGPFERRATWMIGNSLRTDIMPAVTAGIHSIYIKQPNEWQYNMVELQPNPDTSMYTITALEEVPKVIHENIQQQQQKRTLG